MPARPTADDGADDDMPASTLALLAALSREAGQGKAREGAAERNPCIATTAAGVPVADAKSRGLVAVDDAGRMRLTDAGRRLLRRHRSRQTAIRAAASPPARAAAMAPQPQVNDAESPIGWLSRRRDAHGEPLLSGSQTLAGERLRKDMTLAGLTPRTTMAWSGVPSGGAGGSASGRGRDLPDAVIAAKMRVTAALGAVGPEHCDILIDVCGHLRGLEEIARSEGWRRGAVRLLLTRALSALARHYGYERVVPVEEAIARRIRHWGATDYRPRISPPGEADQPD